MGADVRASVDVQDARVDVVGKQLVTVDHDHVLLPTSSRVAGAMTLTIPTVPFLGGDATFVLRTEASEQSVVGDTDAPGVHSARDVLVVALSIDAWVCVAVDAFSKAWARFSAVTGVADDGTALVRLTRAARLGTGEVILRPGSHHAIDRAPVLLARAALLPLIGDGIPFHICLWVVRGLEAGVCTLARPPKDIGMIELSPCLIHRGDPPG